MLSPPLQAPGIVGAVVQLNPFEYKLVMITSLKYTNIWKFKHSVKEMKTKNKVRLPKAVAGLEVHIHHWTKYSWPSGCRKLAEKQVIFISVHHSKLCVTYRCKIILLQAVVKMTNNRDAPKQFRSLLPLELQDCNYKHFFRAMDLCETESL